LPTAVRIGQGLLRPASGPTVLEPNQPGCRRRLCARRQRRALSAKDTAAGCDRAWICVQELPGHPGGL